MAEVSAQPLQDPPPPAERPASQTHSPVVDVWSRTEPKYRFRAIALLILNMLLFCGLCVFTHWLHVGVLFTFTWDSYAAPGRFWDNQTPNLNDFILYPISVDERPIHGVVLGLLLASIVAIPIVIAILYRFRYALPFVAAVLVFAHMPWMAVTLVLCCGLASLRPFRLSFRFGSALVGLLPVILYLYLATRGDSEIGTVASPTQKTLLAAPWVLALLGASAMMALILLIARVVNFRPGAVAPVVAIMFATPFALFHIYVGVDELAYRVLEYQYGPHSHRFEPVEDASDRILAMIRAWTEDDEALSARRGELMAAWAENVAPLKSRVSRRIELEFLGDRAAACDASRAFLADHLRSRYEPCVLYIQARLLDTRLDERRLVDSPPRRELYADFPNAQSAEPWASLLNEYPDSPLATAAALRLGELRLRAGDVDGALELLDRARLEAEPATRPSVSGLLRGRPPEASLHYEPRPDRMEAWRLSDLVRANRDDPRYGNLPLAELGGLDSHRARYVEQLLRLAERYPDSLLFDDVAVLWAASLSDAGVRAAALDMCVQRFENGSAAAHALFLLADVELLAAGDDGASRRQVGIARMRLLAGQFGESYWGHLAAQRLGLLDVPAAPPSAQHAGAAAESRGAAARPASFAKETGPR